MDPLIIWLFTVVIVFIFTVIIVISRGDFIRIYQGKLIGPEQNKHTLNTLMTCSPYMIVKFLHLKKFVAECEKLSKFANL